MPTRLEQLEQLARQNPKDAFVQYAIALEYVGAGRMEEAAGVLAALIEIAPEYSAAYHQAGRVAEQLEQIDEAKRYYIKGIEVAGQQGDLHDRDEMMQALQMLE